MSCARAPAVGRNIATERPGVRVHAHARGATSPYRLILPERACTGADIALTPGSAFEGKPGCGNSAALRLAATRRRRCAVSGSHVRIGYVRDRSGDDRGGYGTGLNREYYGFIGWRQHDAELWLRLQAEAGSRSLAHDPATLVIRGVDKDAVAVRNARTNAQRAGVAGLVQFAQAPWQMPHPHGTEQARRRGYCAPTRRTGCGLMTSRQPAAFIVSWGLSCASVFWDGMRRCFRESRNWDWSLAFVPTVLM